MSAAGRPNEEAIQEVPSSTFPNDLTSRPCDCCGPRPAKETP